MAQTQSANNSSQNANSKSKTSIIAEGTVINGDFNTNENLRIDGSIIGDVSCEKRLVIGKNGLINGKIEAAEVSINGKMIGEVLSKGIINLGSTANAEGKIVATTLVMDEGAIFNGDFVISKK